MKIITGMHRSGTSLVANLFYNVGADLGNPETFYRADRWNSDGYFEQQEILDINIPLINGPWGKLSYFHLPSTNTIRKRADKISDTIRHTADKYRDKVVKETRFCLTLPVWIKYGLKIDGIIVCLRDPVQVAKSIQKRNHIPVRLGLNLWYIHNMRLMDNTQNIKVWFVYYQNLLNSETFHVEMKHALNFFGYKLLDDKLEELRKKCIKPMMNHNKGTTDLYPLKIGTLWNETLKRHEGQFMK